MHGDERLGCPGTGGCSGRIGQAGKLLTNDGTAAAWSALLGDVFGPTGTTVVQGLQGRPVAATSPADGNALRWNAGLNRWEPGIPSISLLGDASGAAGSTIVKALQGRTVSAATPADGQTLKWNDAAKQWEPGIPSVSLGGDTTGAVGSTVVKALQGRALAVTVPVDGQGLTWNATARQWEPGSPNTTIAGDAAGAARSTVVRGLQGRTVASTAPADGQALKWNGVSNQWEPGVPATTLAGDAQGPAGATVVKGLQGLAVSTRSPADGQSLTWNGTSNTWEPGTPNLTLAGDTSGAAGSTTVKRIYGRAIAPSTPADGQVLRWNGATNQWEASTVATSASGDASGPLSNMVVQGLQGRSVSPAGPADGQALTWSAALNEWLPANSGSTLAGDASGPSGDNVVRRLQGRAVSASVPAGGQALKWNAVLNQWEPGNTNDSGAVTLTGDAAGPSGSTLVRGLQGRAVSAAAPSDGQMLKWNAGTSEWEGSTLAGDAGGPPGSIVVRGLQGRTVSPITPGDGQPLKWNAGAGQWEPGTLTLTGDTGGAIDNTVVQALQGRPVSATAPSDGQTLGWNDTLHQWEPRAAAGNYSIDFTSRTSLIIPGSAHTFKTANLMVQCYTASAGVLMPNSIAIADTTYDVTLGFSTPQSGRCLISGGGLAAAGTGGSSAIDSIFGRTGIVTAQTGDYKFPQIGGTVANSQLATGIDAGKIGGGTVSNSAFGYLTNVRSDLQAQIDGKAAAAHDHTSAGDVNGSIAASVVTGIQGRTVAATAPADGQVLAWEAATGQWKPANGGTAGQAELPFSVAPSTATTLSVGSNCSVTTPCNVRFGARVWSIRGALDRDSLGWNRRRLHLCRRERNLNGGAQPGCGLFGRVPIAAGRDRVPAPYDSDRDVDRDGGKWDAQGTDWRAGLSSNVLNAGQGIMLLETGGASTVAVDPALVPTYVSGRAQLDFPAISNGTCAANMTLLVPGASPGNAIAAGWPATLPGGVLGMMFTNTVDTVSVRLCNFSGMVVDPSPGTFIATVIRSL